MTLTILQWNILYKERIEDIAAYIKSVGPDIACLQELTRGAEENNFRDTPALLADALSMNHMYKTAQSWPEYEGYSFEVGDGIYTKFPIAREIYHFVQDPHPDPGEDYTLQGRVYVEAELKIGDKSLTVGTTHLTYSPANEITDRRIKEADRLCTILKEKKSSYIFTGDFNALPESYPVKKISALLQHAGPNLSELTFANKPFEHDGRVVDKLIWRLDYVFVTPDVKVVESKILKSECSDHLPILTTIEL
ncbi:MAG: hypothetical protein A2666_03000 [Parcubacteria group bacterium RIFCSPHIGHO2_01_FULL_47_10b]|nr:MAG: hypothetical protein A2666_03000 [Parcubacteria group bacterium RIFCSPHIGHO2_01_FULL_47_10b]